MLPAYLQLAELGYPVFPCVPGGKPPLTARGCKDATTDAATLERWWADWPDANIGLATDGLLVVDIDVDEGGAANPWLSGDPDKAIDLASAPTSITPRGGRHFLFRQPDGLSLGNTAGKLAPHVDTRGNGGYIVVAPSKLSDGRIYRWVSGELDTRRESLPYPPSWLIEQLTDGARRAAPRDIPEPGAKIPSGQRNDALARLAGTMRRVGLTADEMLPTMQRINQQRCDPPLEDRELETIARSIAKYAPSDALTGVKCLIASSDRDDERDGIGAVAEPENPGDFPEHLLRVPGFIGEVIDYNLNTAFRPQPVLALGGALCLLSTLTGRKIRDVYDTRTNVFAIATCDTSMGKEWAREINQKVLRLSGLEKHLGPESIESAAGLISAIDLEPATLFQLDEFGRHLATMADSRHSFLFNIPTTLMTLFTCSNKLYTGGAYADMKKNKRIDQPHAVVYATSTHEAFDKALTSSALVDGFLGRLLVFEGCRDVDSRMIPKPEIPKSLIEQARWWGDYKPGGNLAGVTAQPYTVEMTSRAQAVIMGLKDLCEIRRKELGNPLGSIWPRAVEKANKLALLWACSANPNAPLVDEDAARWACATVDYLTELLIYRANRNLAENRIEGMVKRVARIIEDAGLSGLTKSQLTHKTKFLTKRERDEALDTLAETGEVSLEQVADEGADEVRLRASCDEKANKFRRRSRGGLFTLIPFFPSPKMKTKKRLGQT
jgi:hypothetical protein